MRNFAVLLKLALVFAIVAPAQVTTGSISGSVMDPSGQRIAGASVKVINELNLEERLGTTSELGDFTFAALAPGAYTIRVEATGLSAAGAQVEQPRRRESPRCRSHATRNR